MKPIRIAVLGFFIVLLLSSCSSLGHHLYYHETPEEQDEQVQLEESLPLVSIQLSGRIISWSEQGGNVVTTYTFEFEDANEFANQAFDYIPFKELGVYVPSALHEGDLNPSEYLDYNAWIRNTSYDWGVAVVDAKGRPDRMDPNILKMLNDNIESEYYLVLDADILDYQWKKWFGLIPFEMTYEISLVLYNNQGEKVVSNHYRHRLTKAPGSFYKATGYYSGLEISLEAVKDEIIEDLAKLGAAPTSSEGSSKQEDV